MNTINTIIIKFPEINLLTRDAHKLRGYFGNVFKEHSPLLHNHFTDGSYRYAYPLVQFKVIDAVPYLVGFNEGADLLLKLFLKIKEIDIEGEKYPVLSKNMQQINTNLEMNGELHEYQFKTLWMALNQQNFEKYKGLTAEEKQDFLNKQLRNNILSFYKGIGYWTDTQIMVKATLTQKQTLFKNKKMIAFTGGFISNAILPNYTGLGKAVSRGFGTVVKKV
jgi:hypothetical protein